MKLENTQAQTRLIESLLLATGYKWKGGKRACYEIHDENGEILFGNIWSEDQAVALMTLAELVQGKTELADFIEN